MRYFDPMQLIFRIRARNLIICFSSLINPCSELIDFCLQLSNKCRRRTRIVWGDFSLFLIEIFLQCGRVAVGLPFALYPFKFCSSQIWSALAMGMGTIYIFLKFSILRLYNWAERLEIKNLMRRSKAQKGWKSHNKFI